MTQDPLKISRRKRRLYETPAEEPQFEINNEPDHEAEQITQAMGNIVYRAEELVTKHALYNAGVGLVPIPLFDIVAFVGVQTNMIKELCELYNVPYQQKVAQALVLALLTNAGGFVVGGVCLFSAIKLIPGIGSLIGVTARPLLLGGTTFAVGMVFSNHMFMGGTLFNLSAAEWSSKYREFFERGKAVVANRT